FTVDMDMRITYFNGAAEIITGVPRKEAIGRKCYEVFHADICEAGCALRKTFQTGRPVVNHVAYAVNIRGEKIPISVSTAVLKDEKGRLVGGVETFRDLAQVEALREEHGFDSRFFGMVSRNHRMHEIFSALPAIAESDAAVLVTGESGTGKELVARALHATSHRKSGPFVPVNCAALPDNLIESELFGHRKGAFTGALSERAGKVKTAAGGTLFLDEIAEMPVAIQAKLLRFLEEKRFCPVGADQAEDADVRIIAATNRDIEKRVSEERFRSDLYYRINVVRIEIPPLRERPEDIPLLVDYFLARLCRRMGKDIPAVNEAVLQMLLAYEYPGNVRELENILEQAFIVCPSGLIELHHLPPRLREAIRLNTPSGSTLEDVERSFLLGVLEEERYNRSAAARKLGIHPTTLWRKMKKLGISKRKK
ncbi:MAG TPA: PAS domain-containing protein, partial [Planctomycetes bacterium]|nr:PAS domain-containing protein [Planctomycetota bacterium]